MKNLDKILRWFLYALPGVLFFSYYPVISFGSGETMNFEFSLPLLWLVMFDVIFVVRMMLGRHWRELWKDIRSGWKWLVFPLFMAISILWSDNVVRGILTCGIVWLIVLAIYAIIKMQKIFYDERVFRYVFLKVFFSSTLIICIWCVVQSILDTMGVSRECTLMCRGCVSQMFGFPHPNGFAIEPQFMGNLLLAPVIVAAAIWLKGKEDKKFYIKLLPVYFFIFVATLFLTFSRGAIYAFGVSLVFMSAFLIVRERKKIIKKVAIVWGVTVLAFVFTLNTQGIMTELGPTNDTYIDGVAKVLNHLSLGIVDVRSEEDLSEEVDASVSDNSDAVFDGYVEESTNIRMELTRDAIEVWKSDLKTALFGVGIGGAGQAMFDAGLTDSPKEIVQNEYASLLIEVGVVGMALLVWLVVMVVKIFMRNKEVLMLTTLIVAYGVSLLFFSGVANALQIYLMPVALYAVFGANIKKNKKPKRLFRSN